MKKFSILLAVPLTASLMFSGVAHATVLSQGVLAVCDVTNINSSNKEISFVDVKPADLFACEISFMYLNEISFGWEDGTFRPLDAVNRDAMAAFMSRFYAVVSDTDLNYDLKNLGAMDSPFTDLDNNLEHYANILWVYNHGVFVGSISD